MRYKQIKDGEWETPLMSRYKAVCCYCGLVHRMQFKIKGRRVMFRCWRDKRATAAVRRAFKGRCVPAPCSDSTAENSRLGWSNILNSLAHRKIEELLAQREEVLRAFIAKHGFEPDRAIQIEQRMPDGTTHWFIRRRTDEGAI